MNVIARLESTLNTLKALKNNETDMYKFQLLSLEVDSIEEVINHLKIKN